MATIAIGVRWRIIGLGIDAGWTMRRIATHFGVSLSAVHRTIRVYRDTGNVIDLPRSGRPSATDRDDDEFIVQQATENPFRSCSNLRDMLAQHHHRNVCSRTISNRLRRAGLNSYRALRFPSLTPYHRDERVAWARTHRRWSALQEWRLVVFTDESRFTLNHTDGRARVRRRRGSRYTNQEAVQHVVPFGGGSVMVWGGISWDDRSPLVFVPGTMTGVRYLNDILAEHAIPFGLRSIGPGFIYQDDNARPHRAAIVNNFHQEHLEYVHMDWPARSPDLNPIEHIWDQIGRSVQNRQPANLVDLRTFLLEEWENLPQIRIRQLFRSMRRRCECTIAAEGGATRY